MHTSACHQNSLNSGGSRQSLVVEVVRALRKVSKPQSHQIPTIAKNKLDNLQRKLTNKRDALNRAVRHRAQRRRPVRRKVLEQPQRGERVLLRAVRAALDVEAQHLARQRAQAALARAPVERRRVARQLGRVLEPLAAKLEPSALILIVVSQSWLAFHRLTSLAGSGSPPSSSTSGAAAEEEEDEPGEERARLRGGMIVSEEEGRCVSDGCRWGGALSRRALGGEGSARSGGRPTRASPH